MAQSFGNFDLLQRLNPDCTDVVVSKWRSRKTGLSVVHLDYDAPIVKGYFAVGTEIFNDSGCPHTLEHLVFMGSKKYPYKGIIDRLATRGFSNGTNAWTADDHTCYTVDTAGGQGFLQILPIYVDHILFPTLSKSAYITEVHHVNPKGEDSGVVYSEMQGRENTPWDLTHLVSRRLLYSKGSGYRSEVGGLMEMLRALDVNQIRDYHAKYYVPHNLCLIVAGKFTGGTDSLLSVVQSEIEPDLVKYGYDKGHRPPGWVRPFVETATADRKPFSNESATVFFPEKDESMGELLMTFMGPRPDDYINRKALEVLSSYLTSSAVAPLSKEYIETDNPLCTYFDFDEDLRPEFVDLSVYVYSVPTEHLEDFHNRFKRSLEKIVKDGIDPARMQMVLRREKRQMASQLESSKGDAFSSIVISDFLLCPEDGSELAKSMNEYSLYDKLASWSNDQWTDLIKKYYIDSPSVVVRAKPSSKSADKLESDEKARTSAQAKALGPEGLALKKKELEDAKAENDKPIPEQILTSFPVPDVKSISWIPVQSAQEGGKITTLTNGVHGGNELRKHINTDGTKLPFFVQFDHVQSDFVEVHALLSFATLPDHLRALVTCYLSAFFSLPVNTSKGESLTFEQVVDRLDDETVSYDANLGIGGYFAENFRASIKVEKEKYEEAVMWLRDLIYGSKFDLPRLQTTCAKIMQGLPELKRDGDTVLASYTSELLYNESNTSRANSVLEQMRAIPELVKELQEKPEKARAKFDEIRAFLTDPSGMRFSVTGNILDIQKPRSVWQKYFGDKLSDANLKPIRLANETLSVVGQNPRKKAIVVSLPSIESSFTTHTTKSIQGFNHPNYPALRIAIEVLNAAESYLWRYIRGSGLAYGASIQPDVEAGLLSFSLYRSSNALQAFKQAADVVEGLVKGTVELDDATIESAKSTIVYNVARSVSTSGSAAISSFINQALKGVTQNYNRDLLEKYQAVTKEQVLESLNEYVLPLFDPSKSVAVVVSAPGKVDTTMEGLRELGFEVEKREVEVTPEELEAMSSEGSESGSEYDDSEMDVDEDEPVENSRRAAMVA